jgi:hypothetical protein
MALLGLLRRQRHEKPDTAVTAEELQCIANLARLFRQRLPQPLRLGRPRRRQEERRG